MQKIICGRAMNGYVTLNSQMHSNALFTFASEREARKDRDRGILYQLRNKKIFICLGLTKVSVGPTVRLSNGIRLSELTKDGLKYVLY